MRRVILAIGFLVGMLGMASAQGADIEATISNDLP